MKIRFCFPLKANEYEVIDGDTVKVMLDRGFNDYKWVSLRFLGLNAPESRTRRTLEKQAGLLVKEIVLKWIEARKGVQLFATSEEKPKFAGRAIGKLWGTSEDEDCLNDFLLNLGVVKAYEGGARNFTDEELGSIISKATIYLTSLIE